jgi:selenocysteine-specific elongation factor
VASGAGGALKDRVAAELERGGLTPPLAGELPARCAGTPTEVVAMCKLLVAEGSAVRVSAELLYDARVLAALRDRLVAWLRERPQITTQQFKDLVGASRKHVIPLAEYFDRERVTLRVGDHRVLRGEWKA